MLKLDIGHIKDYMYCPYLYCKSYVTLERRHKWSSVSQWYEHAMRETVTRFFTGVMNSDIMNIRELKQAFGKIFIGTRNQLETLQMSTNVQRDVLANHEARAVTVLTRFLDRFGSLKQLGNVIAVNLEYELTVGETLISGTLPVIREFNGDIEMLDVRNDVTVYRRNTARKTVKFDPELLAAGMAFDEMFGDRSKLKSFKCYMLGTARLYNVSKRITQTERFTEAVLAVSKAIQHEIYYPVQNYNCMSCVYYDRCIAY